jgi:inner membrane protein involved in colicin E2 resistance
MGLGIILTIASIIGIIYGRAKKSRALLITSVIMLIFIAAIGLYLKKNPY